MNIRTRRLAVGMGVVVLLYASACGYMRATQREHVFEPTDRKSVV